MGAVGLFVALNHGTQTQGLVFPGTSFWGSDIFGYRLHRFLHLTSSAFRGPERSGAEGPAAQFAGVPFGTSAVLGRAGLWVGRKVWPSGAPQKPKDKDWRVRLVEHRDFHSFQFACHLPPSLCSLGHSGVGLVALWLTPK